MMFGLTASAQTITFEANDYKSVGVYDNWEQSPYRNGTLEGNAMIVDNPNTEVDPTLGEVLNPSAKVAAVQRSRLGSNTFGLRIDLKEPFRLTKNNQYLHVMAYFPTKPVSSRVMVMGLGKRVESDWSWQTGEDEQFWCLTPDKVEASESWQDLVFGFKGFSYSKSDNANKGIDIYAIVIVPDVRSPHEDTEDFVCYFDNIEINNNGSKRFSFDKYPINIAPGQKATRTDRALNKVKLGTQTVNNNATYVYNDLTKTALLGATAGQTVSPGFDYNGSWMSGFVYVDWNSDGKFTFTVNDNGTPAEGSEVVSYSASEVNGTWRNSTGTNVGNGNNLTMPSFTIPANQANGFYRVRYKVDWSSLDPGGNPDQDITANGGGIVDLMLDIHAATVKVSDQQLNGAILTTSDQNLDNYPAEYGKAFTVKMDPAPGFIANGFKLRYGYEIDNEEQYDKNGNPRWFEKTFTASDMNDNNEITIPASMVVGAQLKLMGDFVSEGSLGKQITDLSQLRNDMAYFIHSVTGEGYLVWNTEISNKYLSIKGATNTSYQGLPADATAAAAYVEEIDRTDPTESWQILQKDGKFYLYQIAKEAFVTIANRDYVFTAEETPLKELRANSGSEKIDGGTKTLENSFSILAQDADNQHYACICTNTTPEAVRNWTFNDHGSPFYITENPAIPVIDIFNPPTKVDGVGRTQVSPVIYDLQGRIVNDMTQRGVYIESKKKVLK